MLNSVLNTLSELVFGEGLEKKETTYTDMPYIRFAIGKKEITERIIEYGFNNRKFYVLTDKKRLVYIVDKATRKMIHYGDSNQIVNLGGELEKGNENV